MNPRVAATAVSAGVILAATPIVMHFEGEFRSAYRDPVGIVTDCFGHTKTAKMGTTNTHEQCMAKLKADFEEHYTGMSKCLVRELPVNVQAAALSFTFNVGVQKFCTSTMAAKFNVGDIAGGCAEMSRWINAGGKPLPGLVKRRAAERQLCEQDLGTTQ